MGIWWSTILGLVLSAWAVRSPLHSADSNFGRILTTDLPPPGYARAASGHAAALPKMLMKSRRLM